MCLQWPQIVDPAEALLKETTPVPPHEYDGWEDWESWEVPAKIFQLAPMYKLGHDYDGLPGKRLNDYY